MFQIRKLYYRFIAKVSEIETFENYTGFGLYERRVIDIVKSFRDPYPYFRGLIADIGFKPRRIANLKFRHRPFQHVDHAVRDAILKAKNAKR